MVDDHPDVVGVAVVVAFAGNIVGWDVVWALDNAAVVVAVAAVVVQHRAFVDWLDPTIAMTVTTLTCSFVAEIAVGTAVVVVAAVVVVGPSLDSANPTLEVKTEEKENFEYGKVATQHCVTMHRLVL
jgi:hypothetical protein